MHILHIDVQIDRHTFINYIIFPMNIYNKNTHFKRKTDILHYKLFCNLILIHNVMNISQIIKYCSYIMIFNSRIAFQSTHAL